MCVYKVYDLNLWMLIVIGVRYMPIFVVNVAEIDFTCFRTDDFWYSQLVFGKCCPHNDIVYDYLDNFDLKILSLYPSKSELLICTWDVMCLVLIMLPYEITYARYATVCFENCHKTCHIKNYSCKKSEIYCYFITRNWRFNFNYQCY